MKPVPQVPGDQVMPVEAMKEDLAYVERMLREVHPKTADGLSDEQEELIRTLRESINEPMEAQQFYRVATRLLCSMRDGHTYLWPMKASQNRSIHVPLLWLEDGLYVPQDHQPFLAGDRVVAIGGRPVETLVDELGSFISSENRYWLEHSSADALRQEVYLEAMGLIRDDRVSWTVLRRGEEEEVTVGLLDGAVVYERYPRRYWVGYTIDQGASLGIFHLDSCRWNDEYRQTVEKFFQAVKRHRVKHIMVDLRRNGGGHSKVMDNFYSYLDHDQYKSFGARVRYSKASAQQRGTPSHGGTGVNSRLSKNHKCDDPDLLYSGELYILTSVQTFSSALKFAVFAKDNELGIIVGEPTGNQPSNYGDILAFQMPHTGFRFTVSHKYFIRPESANDPADTLHPDVLVYTTINDVLQGRDPQIQKVRELIKE